MARTINFNDTYYVIAHGKITECKIEEITLCVGKIVKHKNNCDISKALQKMIIKGNDIPKLSHKPFDF